MKASATYPLAAVIGYGPNHKIASKLVVSIFERPGQQEPAVIEKWFAPSGDIRKDPAIVAAVADFIKEHHAAQTTTYDRVLGCPHEEGIDYPLGAVCPHCPFWANLDRHTLEPKSLDLPLTPEQIMAGLSCVRDTQPLLSLAAADRHREQMIEPFLQTVEIGLMNPANKSPGDGDLFCYALAFLAKWREPRALPLVIRWLSLPGEGAFDIGGDTVTQWGSRLLASVWGGEVEPIKQLILNREANDLCRGQAIGALAVLGAWNEIPLEEVTNYFGWLAREGLERQPLGVWDDLANACADIEAIPVFDDLRRAYDEELISLGMFGQEDLDLVEVEPRGEQITQFRQLNGHFEDIAQETGWWDGFGKDEFPIAWSEPPFIDLPNAWADSPLSPAPADFAPLKPYIAPPKPGRNDPCPCGSGKKYKKCCGF